MKQSQCNTDLLCTKAKGTISEQTGYLFSIISGTDSDSDLRELHESNKIKTTFLWWIAENQLS